MRSRGGLVNQVPRGDPMTTPQDGGRNPYEGETPAANMRFLNGKTKKRPATKSTTPQRLTKKSKKLPVEGTPLQPASGRRSQVLVQAQRSLLLDDSALHSHRSLSQHEEALNSGSHRSTTTRQKTRPTCNQSVSPEISHQGEARNRNSQRSTSASQSAFLQRRPSSPQLSPMYPRSRQQLAPVSPRRSPRLSRRQESQFAPNERIACELGRRGGSHEDSSSPMNAESASQPAKIPTPRGITTLPKLALRDTTLDKLKVEVSKNDLVGTFSLECILAIGMWVRQSENFPLSVRLFRHMPEEKISRVSKLVRDYYILVPDDENAEKAIRTQMRLAYVRYRSVLAKHYRSFDSHEEALLHPSTRIRNVNDWTELCNFFNNDEAFKKASEKARAARKAQALNHTSGTKSFARQAYERARKNLPVDPLSMFMVTHKASKLGKLCEDWQAEMNELSEKVRSGEVNYTPEEIYSKVVDPRRYGGNKRVRKSKVTTHFSMYEKNEAQMTALQEQLDSEKEKVAKQDKEISKLQRRERNLREHLNEALKKIGCQPLPEEEQSGDESEDGNDLEVDDRRANNDLEEHMDDDNSEDEDFLNEDVENRAGDDQFNELSEEEEEQN